MIHKARIGLVVALVGAGLMLAASPAHAGNGLELKLGKAASGPFNEQVRRNVPLGEKRNVFIRAKSFDAGALEVTLFSPNADDDYRMKYFKSNGTNITSDVAAGGYDFTLGAGKQKVFRMQIKAKDGTDPECVSPNVIYPVGLDDSATVAINTPILTCVI